MRKNIWKVITLISIMIILYGIIDIYHKQYNLVKHINHISGYITSINHIEVLDRHIKTESYKFRPGIDVRSVNVSYRRLYTSSLESAGRVPYKLEIDLECRQSFLGLFSIRRKFSVKPTVLLYQ